MDSLVEENSQIEQKEEVVTEEDLIDTLLTEDTQTLLFDYYINTLFNKDTKFTEGLSKQDYDIILSSLDAEGQEIFHSLNICNCKYDPKSKASKKVIHYEELEKVMTNFLKWKGDKEKKYKENPDKKEFAAIYMHAYPMIRRNLKFDINSITFKEVINNKQIGDYKVDKLNENDKNLIFFVSFKLNGKTHKFDKIKQLLEQFDQENLKKFWNYFKLSYFIFCVEEEKDILTEYNIFPEWLRQAMNSNPHCKFIFFVDPQGEDPNQTMNIFKTSEFEKDYYFMLNPQNLVYKADSMLCSGDIVENYIRRKEENIKKYTDEEKFKALYDFYNFVENIKNYKYNFFFAYQLEVCLKYNQDDRLSLNYVNFSHLIAELRTKEYEILKKCEDIFKPDMCELTLIETFDIPIDFTLNNCIKCKRNIQENEEMYYCYKCKEKYCTKCVMNNFNDPKNKGLKQFIDPKHNLLFFKTRNVEHFKNIEKFKLGNDSFANCKDETKLGNHSMLCNGCGQLNNYIKPRFLCLSCKPGIKQDDGFADYCIDCIGHMSNNDKEGKRMQNEESDLFNQESRFFYEDKTKIKHDHSTHVYLMIALEYKISTNPYYDF